MGFMTSSTRILLLVICTLSLALTLLTTVVLIFRDQMPASMIRGLEDYELTAMNYVELAVTNAILLYGVVACYTKDPKKISRVSRGFFLEKIVANWLELESNLRFNSYLTLFQLCWLPSNRRLTNTSNFPFQFAWGSAIFGLVLLIGAMSVQMQAQHQPEQTDRSPFAKTKLIECVKISSNCTVGFECKTERKVVPCDQLDSFRQEQPTSQTQSMGGAFAESAFFLAMGAVAIFVAKSLAQYQKDKSNKHLSHRIRYDQM